MSVHRCVNMINTFLGQSYTGQGVSFSSDFGVKSVFDVPVGDVSDFYSQVMGFSEQEILRYFQDEQNEDNFNPTAYGLPFCEKVGHHIPIIVDMKFKFRNQSANHFYGNTFILAVTRAIQELILIYADVKEFDGLFAPELVCFVLESAIWAEGNEEFQRVRFHFPYTKISKEIVNGFIIRELIEDLVTEDFMKHLLITPLVTNWNEIIQPVDEVLSMYGCKQFEHEAPLVLKCILNFEEDFNAYDTDKNEVELRYNPSYIPLDTDEINPLTCGLFSQGLVSPEVLDYQNKAYSLPLILSIYFCSKFTILRTNLINLGTPVTTTTPFRPSVSGACEDENQRDIFNQLINMISPERFSNEQRYSWYLLGKCIYNIFGDHCGFSKFEELTSADLKSECRAVWDTFSVSCYDIRTVMELAKQDSLEAFRAWHKDYCNRGDLIRIAVGGKDMIVAELAKRALMLEYIYCTKSKNWYRKERSVLKEDLENLDLRNSIRAALKPFYVELSEALQKEQKDAPTMDQKKQIRGKIAECDKMLDRLEGVDYLDKVIKALKGGLKDDNFSKLQDENLNLIACTNVVMECYDKTITTRLGLLQDYITKSTRIAFPFSYNDDTAQVKFLMKYYGQVHTDKEAFHFFLKDMASFLQGGNEEKYFRNWIGESNASKSQVVKLIQAAMGDLCIDFPDSSITVERGRTSGGPDPALEQAKGCRVAIVSETSANKPLDGAKIKKFTGNDRYWNRSLHKEGGSRMLTFKLIHMSNVIATPNDADEAYKIREVIYAFLSKWVDNPPSSIEEQYEQRRFKKDEDFSKRINSLAQAQLYLMFRYFPIYKKEGIRTLPEIFKRKTEEHHREIDPFYNFIMQKLDVAYINEMSKERDILKTISLDDMFVAYRQWFQRYSPDTPLQLNQTTFKNEMCKSDRLGTLDERRQWSGISFRQSTRST